MVADPERFAASAARTADRADRAVRRPAGGGASRRRAAQGSETVERADVRCGAGLADQARRFRQCGMLDAQRLHALGITRLGFTQTVAALDTRGTPLYLAPEVLRNRKSVV